MRITYDASGTPGIHAQNELDARYGLGLLHGLHRPLQALLLGSAGTGRLAERLIARAEVVHLDALAHRLDLPALGQREARRLPSRALERIRAYLEGLSDGLSRGGVPFELRALFAQLPVPDVAAVLSGFAISAYLGLAEGQERMERALVEAVREGASSGLLEQMFHPHLKGWDPERIAKVPPGTALGFASHGMSAAGGSNVWAVAPSRTRSGNALLAADPHLQVNQLPALFFEVRANVGEGYWLGATIPGLPSLAVGRNRHVAFSGTFGVADNVDSFLEEVNGDHVRGPGGALEPIASRTVEIGRRFKGPLGLTFSSTPRGALEGDVTDGLRLSTAWSGTGELAEALDAYLQLPLATSAADAENILSRAHTLSLHFVLADRDGDVRYLQVGRIPRRTEGWSGLYPVPADGDRRWDGIVPFSELPKSGAAEGFVASANEARLGAGDRVLSTLAQPRYRLERIESLLRARSDHDTASMMAMQVDLHSRQAERLVPRLLPCLPTGPLKEALQEWSFGYGAHEVGPHAFQLAYRAALSALAPELGGDWFLHVLEHSELSVWWCHGLDRILDDAGTCQGARGARIQEALAAVASVEPGRWSEVQTFTLPNLILGGLPNALGFDRGPLPLAGGLATISQGNLLKLGDRTVAVAPAYRFVTDLGEDRAYSTLPGGIDGSRFSKTYDLWLPEYLAGGRHVLEPPTLDEAPRP